MVSDKYNVLGPILGEIGQVLAEVVGGDPNGVFFYVEIGQGWVSPNIFRDEGAVVRCYDPPGPSLSDLLFELWYAESDDDKKRWSVMEYTIEGGKFEAAFRYPDEVKVESVDGDRVDAALQARFGDKPVVYPPMEGMFEYKPDGS